MSTVVAARVARADSGTFRYQRHQPEKTLLYQLVLKHYPDFRRQLVEEGRLFEKDSSHWSSHIDSAIWTVRRLYALRVPGAPNLNPNAGPPLHQSDSRCGKAAFAYVRRQHLLPVEDTVSGKLAP